MSQDYNDGVGLGAFAMFMIFAIVGFLMWRDHRQNKTKRKRMTQLPGLPSEEARAAAYLQAPDHALFLAVLADLREFAVEVSDRALDPELPDAQLRWHTGGTDALLEFLEKLQTRERDARLTAEQLAAQKAGEVSE